MKEIKVKRGVLRRVWALWGATAIPFFRVSR